MAGWAWVSAGCGVSKSWLSTFFGPELKPGQDWVMCDTSNKAKVRVYRFVYAKPIWPILNTEVYLAHLFLLEPRDCTSCDLSNLWELPVIRILEIRMEPGGGSFVNG